MPNYAMVNDTTKVVDNIVLWDGNSNPATGGWQPPAGYTMVQSDEAAPGWSYDGATFTPPPTPEPA